MPPMLDASGLCFAYDRVAVLQDVALSVASGQVVALLGPNGSGKSTLMRALLGQLPASGRVLWEGRALEQWTRRELARRVAYLPQFPAFEPAQRVADVLRLGRAPYWGAFGLESPRDLEVVGRVSDMLELGDLLQRPMEALSGGQRQRAFIGRCLVQEPRAVLLDEPNTSLDLKHQVELCRLLKRLAVEQNLAVLMASHDLNLAATYADRLLLLAGGRLVAGGEPGEMMDPELLTRVYDLPMERVERPGHRRPVVLPVTEA